jgi:hypothetical protein
MSELVNMAQQFSGLPMESLIGGPLIAAAEANLRMGQAQTSFILNTCFTKVKDGENERLEAIMVPFVLSRPAKSLEELDALVPDGRKKEAQKTTDFTIKLPLLVLIPINALGVTNVDINFEMEVKSSSETKEKVKSESTAKLEATLEGEASVGFLIKAKVNIKGTASYSSTNSNEKDTHYQKSNNAKYTVNVKAGQLPLSDGIKSVLKMYNDNIVPTLGPKQIE